MKELIFATHNHNKVEEVKAVFNEYNIKSLADVDYHTEIEETAKTFEGNALLKAKHIYDVFKTAVELDQRWVIEMAGDRQQYICQSQSLNVFFPANVSKQELHATHMMAWKKGVKTLYYLRSEAYKRAENVSDEALRRQIFEGMDDDGCFACEG